MGKNILRALFYKHVKGQEASSRANSHNVELGIFIHTEKTKVLLTKSAAWTNPTKIIVQQVRVKFKCV